MIQSYDADGFFDVVQRVSAVALLSSEGAAHHDEIAVFGFGERRGEFARIGRGIVGRLNRYGHGKLQIAESNLYRGGFSAERGFGIVHCHVGNGRSVGETRRYHHAFGTEFLTRRVRGYFGRGTQLQAHGRGFYHGNRGFQRSALPALGIGYGDLLFAQNVFVEAGNHFRGNGNFFHVAVFVSDGKRFAVEVDVLTFDDGSQRYSFAEGYAFDVLIVTRRTYHRHRKDG